MSIHLLSPRSWVDPKTYFWENTNTFSKSKTQFWMKKLIMTLIFKKIIYLHIYHKLWEYWSDYKSKMRHFSILSSDIILHNRLIKLERVRTRFYIILWYKEILHTDLFHVFLWMKLNCVPNFLRVRHKPS